MKFDSASGPRMVPSTIGAIGNLKRSNRKPTRPNATTTYRSGRLLRAAKAPTKQNSTTKADTRASGASSTLHRGLIAK